MSEIINLNVKLQNNPFAGMIIPLVAYFNDPEARARNPWSALAAGALLNNRSLNWNDGPNPPLQAINYKKCCCPSAIPGQGVSITCTYQRITQQGGGPPCPQCESKSGASAATSGPIITQQELIKLGSRDAGFDDPYVPAIRTFEQQLGGMSMNGNNDYVFFQQMVDIFYAHVDFISYFTSTALGGSASDLYLNMLGGTFREGYEPTGVVVSTVTDGSPGNIPVKDVTRVKMDATGFTEALLVEGPYVAIRVNPTQRDIIWFGVGTSYIQPVVAPIGGVADTYHKVTLAVSQNAAQNSLNAKNQIEGFSIAGLDLPVVEGGDTVAISNSIAGPQTPTTFTSFVGLTGFDGTWLSSYQDGTGQPATTGESVVSILPGIDSSFENKYFEIYTSPSEILVPWINLGSGGGVEPVVVPPGDVGVQYFEVVLPDPGGIPIATYAQQLADALTLAPGITVTKTGVADATIITDLVGSRTATDYTNWDDVGKQIGVFVDGQDAGTDPGGKEATNIDFYYAVPSALKGRWFKMYNGVEEHLFYYQNPRVAIDPATLGTSYDFAHAINLDVDRYKTQLATDSVIAATGLWSVGLREKCCECIGCDNAGNPCCEPCCACPGNSCGTLATLIAELDSTDSIGGTASVGPYAQVNEVISPDGTNYGTVEGDLEYARLWNLKVVPEMAAKGRPTHNLKPVYASQIWCCINSDCTQKAQIPGPGPCPEVPSRTEGMIMLQTTYPSITEDLRFNTPGTTTFAHKEKRCKTCLM